MCVVSIADRDLVFQDLELVLVPGIRLNCLARAGARGVRRFVRTGEGLRMAPSERAAQSVLRARVSRTKRDEKALCSTGLAVHNLWKGSGGPAERFVTN